MQEQFSGKTAFVTGAGSGIGAAVTRSLLERGASVVGSDINLDGLTAFGEEFGERFVSHRVDVTLEADLAGGVDAAVSAFGRLDLAFNVAGVSKGAPIVDLEEELWDFNVDRILKGVFLSVKQEARAMQKSGGGAIVNISSLNAHVPMHTGSAYASAKAGVEMFTKSAALELAADGIRVNAILPGLIDTPLTQRRLTNAPLMEHWLTRIPVGRPGTATEVANACLFLASDQASYVTGTSLVVDGGWEITGYPDLRKYA